MKFWLAIGLAVASAGGAETTTQCLPPAQWANWNSQKASAGPAIAPGMRMELALKPFETVPLAAPPGRPSTPGSFAGIFPLQIARKGQLHIALSDASYVDLVRKGAAIASTGHEHGPLCTTIHKIVTFDVVPGPYTVQITGAPAASVRLLTVAE